MTEAVQELAPHPKGGVRGGIKTPGSGRRPGSRNRVTREIAELAQRHGKSIVAGLMKEFRNTDDPDLKVKIAQLVLSYGYGQPTRRSEVSGPDGSPIQRQDMIIHASERVAAAFTEVIDADDPAEQLNDDSLRAVQAVSFITAAKEAQVRRLEGRSSKAGGIENLASAPAEPEPAEQVVTDAEPINPEPQPPPPGATLTFMERDLNIVGLPPDRPNLPTVYALHGSAGLMKRGNWDLVLAAARKQAGSDDLGAHITQQPRAQGWEPSRADQREFAAPPPRVVGSYRNRRQ